MILAGNLLDAVVRFGIQRKGRRLSPIALAFRDFVLNQAPQFILCRTDDWRAEPMHYRPVIQPDVIYQDSCLIAVNKPAGMLSVPGRGADKQDCVVSRLQSEFADIRVVHRLDCDTSGIMLLAKGLEMQRLLSRLFHDREIEKSYVALVEGAVSQPAGEIDIPLRGDPLNRPRQVIDHLHGKQARTRWRLLHHGKTAAGATTSRLQLKPITGRTHQLRVHCMAMGHPIVGDRLYNESDDATGRMLLHAERLEFTHPASSRGICLEAICDF